MRTRILGLMISMLWPVHCTTAKPRLEVVNIIYPEILHVLFQLPVIQSLKAVENVNITIIDIYLSGYLLPELGQMHL